MGFGSVGGGYETPFLSTRGTLLSHVELSREVRRSREEQEERKREKALNNAANKRVNAELIDLQTTWLQVQARLDEYFGPGNVPASIQDSINYGESPAHRFTARSADQHGATLAAQFQGDPLLTSEEQARLRLLVKDQKDRQALNKGGGGGGARGGRGLGVRGGKVNPPKWGSSGSGPKQSVSGSSQLIASSVSSGLATSAERKGIYRVNAPRSPRAPVVVSPPAVGSLVVPLALQARGDFTFNNNVKVSEIELLEKFEGGGVVTEDNGLAVMF